MIESVPRMPTYYKKGEHYEDVVSPTDPDVRADHEKAVLAAYRGDHWGSGRAGVGSRITPPPDHLSGRLARDPRDEAA